MPDSLNESEVVLRPAVRPKRRRLKRAFAPKHQAPRDSAKPPRRRLAAQLRRALAATSAGHRKLDLIVATIFLLSYLARVSILRAVLKPLLGTNVSYIYIAGLVLTLGYILRDGKFRIQSMGVLLLAGTGISTLSAENFSGAVLRWAGWAGLVAVVGPVFGGETARQFRAALLRVLHITLLLIIGISTLWWASRVPGFGRGTFSGPMSHSMILAPLAALTAVMCLAAGISRRSWRWFAMFAVAAAMTLLTGSRGALGAMVLGSAAVTLLRYPTPGGMLAFAALVLIAVASRSLMEDWASQHLDDQLSERYFNRGLFASREGAWEARWAEFLARPVCGVGFGQVVIRDAKDDDDRQTVEPGSSYLAVLSMSGMMGALALLGVIGVLWRQLWLQWKNLPLEPRLVIGGWAALWAIHLFSEGYIFSVGSLLCVLLWFLGGIALDLGEAAEAKPA